MRGFRHFSQQTLSAVWGRIFIKFWPRSSATALLSEIGWLSSKYFHCHYQGNLILFTTLQGRGKTSSEIIYTWYNLVKSSENIVNLYILFYIPKVETWDLAENKEDTPSGLSQVQHCSLFTLASWLQQKLKLNKLNRRQLVKVNWNHQMKQNNLFSFCRHISGTTK